MPPPTSDTIELLWCGARNGARRIIPTDGSRTPAAECTIVASRASAGDSGGSRPGQPLRQHRLARARRTDQQHVVPARSGDLQRLASKRLAANVGEIGRRRLVVDVVVVGLVGPRRLAVERVDDLAEVLGDTDATG